MIAGDEPTGGITNYFAGPPTQWRRSIPHYARAAVHNLYRNIEVSYYFRGEDLEFNLHIRPGSDLRTARFRVASAIPRLESTAIFSSSAREGSVIVCTAQAPTSSIMLALRNP